MNADATVTGLVKVDALNYFLPWRAALRLQGGVTNSTISTYTVLTPVYGGTLIIENKPITGHTSLIFDPGASAGAGNNIYLNVAGRIDLQGHDQAIGTLEGDARGIIASDKAATLAVNQTTDGTYAGTLSGPLTLKKEGGSTLTLSGSNACSGGTTVSTRTLVVNGTTTGPITVNTGATLGGRGMVDEVAVKSGGRLAPGKSTGVLSRGSLASGNLTLEPNSLSSCNVSSVNHRYGPARVERSETRAGPYRPPV